MTDEEYLEARGKELYDECPSVKPKWEQLGEACKSVWRERAAKELAWKKALE